MLRSGRFRHRLLDETFLNQHAAQAHRSLSPFLALWHQGQFSDVEIACVYIWIFCLLRRPQDFFGGPHSQPLHFAATASTLKAKSALQILKSTLPDHLQNTNPLKRFDVETSFVEFFCSHSWRSIPYSVARSLCEWYNGSYDLKLLTTIPSVEEVLEMQAQGRRCVSMLVDADEIQNFVLEGRDVLGFIIHDLIHADHFFHHRDNAKAQIQFSQKLVVLRQFPQIDDMMSTDSKFRDELHYLMSDMNSVPLHLLKTLKAVVLGYFKRRDQVEMNALLSSQSEAEFRGVLETLLAPWNMPPMALEAIHRLNTPLNRGLEDNTLIDQALRE